VLLTLLVYASPDHPLFVFGGKKVKYINMNIPSFPLAEEKGDERSDVGVSKRRA
jgi:hypothetical protein